MKTLEKLASVFVLGALLSSCGGKKASTNTESDGDSPRVEAYSFDVTETICRLIPTLPVMPLPPNWREQIVCWHITISYTPLIFST